MSNRLKITLLPFIAISRTVKDIEIKRTPLHLVHPMHKRNFQFFDADQNVDSQNIFPQKLPAELEI